MVLDWLILRIPGWNRKVRKLRKMWDRSREHALTKKGTLRQLVMQKLDSVSAQLRMIEEQPLTRVQRKKFAREIEIVLAEVKVMLKGDSGDYTESALANRAKRKNLFTGNG